METTVTMSIERYKELEEKEKSLTEYMMSGKMHYHRSSYGTYLTNDESTKELLIELSGAIEATDATISKMREAEQKHGKKLW